MKKVYFFTFVIFFSAQSYSQNNQSTVQEVNQSLEDFRRKLHKNMDGGALDAALNALSYAEKNNNDSLALKANALLEMYYDGKSQYFISIEYGMRALEIAKSLVYEEK